MTWKNDPLTPDEVNALDVIAQTHGILHTKWAVSKVPASRIMEPAWERYHPTHIRVYFSDQYIPLQPDATWLDVWKACDASSQAPGSIEWFVIEDDNRVVAYLGTS